MTTDSPTSGDEVTSTGITESDDETSPNDKDREIDKTMPKNGIKPLDEYREVIDDVVALCREKFDDLLDEISLKLADETTAETSSSEPAADSSTTANGDQGEP